MRKYLTITNSIIAVCVLFVIANIVLGEIQRNQERTKYDNYAQALQQKQNIIVQSAITKISECKALGDKSINRFGKVIVWNIDSQCLHTAEQELNDSLNPYLYSKGTTFSDDPVTVFLVSHKDAIRVGSYDISGEAAYRELVEVYVVNFTNLTDSGTPVGTHKMLSLDPVEKRQLSYKAQYGNVSSPIANWINLLPSK